MAGAGAGGRHHGPMNPLGGAAPDLVTLTALTEAFAQTVPTVPADVPVPWCGSWLVGDLVEHLAQVHHWAAGQAQRREAEPVAWSPAQAEDGYRRCAHELLTTLATLAPDSPAWTLDESGVSGFWHRRQVHETLVHLWDLRTAGGSGLDVPPALWADTVDEVVAVMAPRQVRLGRLALPARAVTLVATDTPGRWTLPSAQAGAPAATVHGPAAALALLLWARTGLDDPTLHVTGDATAVHEALAGALTP